MTNPDDPQPPPPLEDPFPEEPAGPAEDIAATDAAPPAAETPASEMPTAEMPTLEMLAAEDEESPVPRMPAPAVAVTGRVPAPASKLPRAARPDLLDRQAPLYRACGGYRLRLEPADLARLRELPGSRGKSDDELGESFFDGQAERLAAAVAGDVPSGAELRVVVDPYSRQAFVALENRIRGILSF